MKKTTLRTQESDKKPSFVYQVHRYNEKPHQTVSSIGDVVRSSNNLALHLVTPTFLFPKRYVKPVV